MSVARFAACLLATLLAATPAKALTIVGTANFDESGEAVITGPGSDLGTPGVYRFSFTLDEPASAAAIYVYARYTYNFFDREDGTYYGGDDVPIEPIYEFPGPTSSGSALFTLDRPYEIFYGNTRETGFYSIEGSELRLYGDPDAAPIGYSFSVDWLRPVPEPEQWALLITGFGAAGAMLRRRSRRTLAA